jgi:hypothetical protein
LKGIEMTEDGIFWGVTIVCMLISIPAAYSMDESLHKKHPNMKPYKWGYYIGWMGTLGGAPLAVLQFIAASKTYGSSAEIHVWLGVVLILGAIAHIFVLKRNKWVWIAAIILQLNPILWIVNGVYLKNRWSELSGIPLGAVSPRRCD